MTKAQMLDAMRNEFNSCKECELFYADVDNPKCNPRTARDFSMRANQTQELAYQFFGVDLLEEWLDENYPID